MHTTLARHRSSLLLFVCTAIGIYATALWIVAQPSLGARSNAVAAGITLDLVVVVPLAFYLLVVRRLALPIVTLAPVLVLSAVAASRVLPADRQQTLGVLELLAIPMELGVIGWIGFRTARVIRNARSSLAADPLERLRSAALELTRNDRASAILASEVAVFWYAIGAWRAQPHVPDDSIAFTHHRRSGHAGMVLAFILAMSVEAIAVHVLLINWSAIAAWILTIGTAYAAVWLVADYRATVLRPILVEGDRILFRAGFRCTAHVPVAQILAVGSTQPEVGKASIDLTFLGTPTRWLTLSEPVIAEGPYGFRRPVRCIGIAPDAAEEFDRLLDDRIG